MDNGCSSDRFSRLALILGQEALDRLKGARVMVVGLGGVGSSCAEALARGGLGSLILIDGDVVEESNINRQALAFSSTLGMAKVEAMRRMVGEINTDCQLFDRQVFLTPDNLQTVLSEFPRPDYVIDCIDTVSQKLALAEWCMAQGLPLLSAMGAANKLDPAYLKFAPIEKTMNCPLSKVIRRECRKRGIQQLEVIFSSEPPVKINSFGEYSKAMTLGSMSYMPPIMGQMLAGKVICRLAGLEDFTAWPAPSKEGKSR